MTDLVYGLLIPLMWFHFDSSWPTGGTAVFMTPTKVWGPLSVAALGWLAVGWRAAFLVVLVYGLWVLFEWWKNPHVFDSMRKGVDS